MNDTWLCKMLLEKNVANRHNIKLENVPKKHEKSIHLCVVCLMIFKLPVARLSVIILVHAKFNPESAIVTKKA